MTSLNISKIEHVESFSLSHCQELITLAMTVSGQPKVKRPITTASTHLPERNLVRRNDRVPEDVMVDSALGGNRISFYHMNLG